jgi:predicted nucleic acid-binding Zn ribbon protein
VIYPVGHILKGSGFYRTDYRSKDFEKKEKEQSAAPAVSAEHDPKKPREKRP